MRRLLGNSLIVVGILAVLAGAIGWHDVGNRMADDNDPFGPPQSRSTLAAIVVLGIVSCAVGRRLWRTSYRKVAA
jgi:uncharacterized membrane protein YidH (DUF202 family)